MIDHFGIGTKDYLASKEFYKKALAPLGYVIISDITEEMTGDKTAVAGFGKDGIPDFWIANYGAGGYAHLAVRAESREEVDAFYAAALNAGGTDNGKPGIRPQYTPTYYAAFVKDLDGNNIEAVCHNPL